MKSNTASKPFCCHEKWHSNTTRYRACHQNVIYFYLYLYINFFFSLFLHLSMTFSFFLSFFLSFCEFCCVWLFFRLHPFSVILCFCDFLFVWLSVCVAFILFDSFLSALFFCFLCPFLSSTFCFRDSVSLWLVLCDSSCCDNSCVFFLCVIFCFCSFFSARFSVTYSLSSLFFLLVVLSKVALLKSLWLWSFSTILFS